MIKGADQAMTVLIPAILDWELLAEPMPSSRPTPTDTVQPPDHGWLLEP
jgi:hypothetical protein